MLTLAEDTIAPTFELVDIDDLSHEVYGAIEPSIRDTLVVSTLTSEVTSPVNICFVVADVRLPESANHAIEAARQRAEVSEITVLVVPEGSSDLTGDLGGARCTVVRVGDDDLVGTMARVIEAPLVAMEGGIIGWRFDDLLPVLGGPAHGVGVHGASVAEIMPALVAGGRTEAAFALVRLPPAGSLHDINDVAMALNAELGDDVEVCMTAVIDETLTELEMTVIGTRRADAPCPTTNSSPKIRKWTATR